MKPLKTLRVRFALWTASWLLLILSLAGAFIYLNFARRLAQTIDDALRLTAAQILLGLDDETLQLEDVTVTSTLQEQFGLQILNTAGQVRQQYGLYQNFPTPVTQTTTPDDSGTFTTFTDPATQHPVRLYTIPIVEENRELGTLQVAQSLLSVRQALKQLLITLLVAGPMVTFAAGIGGYILAARALNPIDQITRTAARISVEDLSARLNLPPTADEVGRLAATFDTMLARLDDGFQRERRFTADASHELRTPLATMQTILSSTLARRRTPPEYEQALADLVEETERMKTLAEGLLALARNDNTRSTAFEMVDLAMLLRDVTDSLRPLAEDKNLTLTCDLSGNLPLMGDSDGLVRLFVNVVENAIKYTDRGSVTVSLSSDTPEFVEIAIADTGIGIPTEHLPHIFNRFYQVDESRATSGAGLGLAIALSVAQIHGGTIDVESELGKGTVFSVKLVK